MKAEERRLRHVALLFLIPGLAGLIVSAMFSTYYLQILPKRPIPAELRMTPRNIDGILVYQTEHEDRKLTMMEDVSVGVFVVGLSLGLVYLWKWGIAIAISGEEDKYELERP